MRLTDSQIFWVTIVLAIFPMRASSEDIPKIMLGEWVEPGTGCPGNIVELYRDEGKIRELAEDPVTHFVHGQMGE